MRRIYCLFPDYTLGRSYFCYFSLDISSNGLLLKKVEDGKRVNLYHFEDTNTVHGNQLPVFKSMIGPTGITTDRNER